MEALSAHFLFQFFCCRTRTKPLEDFQRRQLRGFVTVQTAEEFQQWMDERVKELAEPDPFK